MNKSYNILLNQLDKFRKKYFLNKLIYGIGIFILIGLTIILFTVFLDKNIQLNSISRAIIFYASLSISIILFIVLVFIPFLAFVNILKPLSRFAAAKLISERVPEIKDELINVVELDEKMYSNAYSIDLIQASIEQKAEHIYKFSISDVISFRKILKSISLVIFIAVIAIIVISFKKDDLRESSKHYLNYNKEYKENVKRIRIDLLNKNLEVERGDNIEIEAIIKSKKQIEIAYINYGGNKYLLKRINNIYSYSFKSINKGFDFTIEANGVLSKNYSIVILKSPLIIQTDITINPPDYTGIGKDEQRNNGDLIVPEGSKINWIYNTLDVDTLTISFSKAANKVCSIENNLCEVNKLIYKSQNYSLIVSNKDISERMLFTYNIKVINDKYPAIEVKQIRDTSTVYGFYFNGSIKDDYGFEKLLFILNINEQTDSIEVALIQNNDQGFFFYYDFEKNVQINDNILYWFEVWDNDKINGNKSARTSEQAVKKITIRDLSLKKDSLYNLMEKNINEAIELSNDINNNIEKLRQADYTENISQFEKKSLIDNILNDKAKLEESIEMLKKNYNEKNIYNKLNEKEREDILEKQKQIQELLENLLSDEIRQLLEELEKLKEDLANSDKIEKLSEQIEFSIEDLKAQMENSLELLKKMEIEERIEQTIKSLEELQKENKKLTNDLSKDNIKSNNSKEEAKKLKEDFDQLMDEYEKAVKENENLKYKLDLDPMLEQKEKINTENNELQNNIENNNYKKAKNNLSQLQEQQKEMASAMRSMLEKNRNEGNSIDIELLTVLIDNINRFSFLQEDLLEKLKQIDKKDPIFIDYYNEQKNLNRIFVFINNQIDTLSLRTPAINHLIRTDINDIKRNILMINNSFEERNKSKILTSEQFVMTHANNLALKLNEVLNSLDSQDSSSGNGDCKKPGKPKPGLGGLKKQQEGIKNQLQNMISELKKGKGKKPGNSELSKLLAQQEIMRQMLDALSISDEVGKGAQKELNEIKKMVDENIKDIINNNIGLNLLQRQELIKTRLLRAENSEFEREEEKRRKSSENLSDKKSNPIKDFEYNKENYNFNELLRKKSVKFNEFYNKKSIEYFENITK